MRLRAMTMICATIVSSGAAAQNAAQNAVQNAAPIQLYSANPDPAAPIAWRSGLRLPDIPLRDPWILVDKATHSYLLYTSASMAMTGRQRGGTFVYQSHDLRIWEGPSIAFLCPDDGWADATQKPWAPEVHAYRGKYYLFTTLHNPQKPMVVKEPYRKTFMRGTVIAVSDTALGPYVLLKKDAPLTPANFMTLDGTLYVDPSGKPWMVYAHEWVQKIDGTMEALPLLPDLSAAAGDPIFLFKASDAPWLDEQAVPDADYSHYVTDGPELFRSKDGHLLMLWASYERNALGNDSYIETQARSKSGELKGPWEQLPPLIGNDSGHGMLFHTLEGQLMIIVHQPNNDARGKIYEVQDLGDRLQLGKYREDLSGPMLGAQAGRVRQQ